ncbi:MAG: Menaquinone reductase, iron-sulfur cluster-binding subunit [Calditrichaeota bacterium]|nr:Menaquinone reductase, iron-sulfur cluster-binding subunit [Calditrichota bacterium]
MPSVTNGNRPRPLYWRSEEQLRGSDRFRHWLDHEFPEPEDAASDAGDGGALDVSRRGFLGIIGASMALAGFSGCRKPVEKIVPHVNDPEYRVQGVPSFYATSEPRSTSPLGLLVETHEGRPTKVEGNELHPSSGGGADMFALASLLDLYDPDRVKYPTRGGARKTWAEFVEFWRRLRERYVANGGRGLAVLSEPFSSPTIARVRERFLREYPEARWIAWEPVSTENRDRGVKIATGKSLRPVHRFDEARVILSLDSDFVVTEPDAVRDNRDFGRGRKLASPQDEMNRLYAVESALSVTGGKADHRLRLQSRQVGAFAATVAVALEKHGITVPGARVLAGRAGLDFHREWVAAVAEDLAANHGRGLVIAGLRQPPAVHALALAINTALGNTGRTVLYRPYDDALSGDTSALAELVEAMRGGEIETLAVLGANPVLTAPADVNFAGALANVEHTLATSPLADETARACEWHLPRSHYMESWGDARSSDGALSLIQPQIRPLYETHSELELANLLATGLDSRGYDLVRKTWFERFLRGDKERAWKIALHDGVLERSTRDTGGSSPVVDAGAVAELLREERLPVEPARDGFEVVFAASNTIHDGRWANNAWLAEMPDPVTKNSWGNAAVMSRATAARVGVDTNDGVTVEVNGASVELPAYVLPGHADGSVTLELGWGRPELGRVTREALGVDVYPLRSSRALGFTDGARVRRSGRRHELPNVQDHGAMEGRAIVREATLDTYRENRNFAGEMAHVPDLQSLWKEHTYEDGYQWGMAIDLNACTNCNACVIACQSENNTPTVGPDRVRAGREMHWMRLDRYFVGDQEDARVANQPMLCQHCEMAPCEQVCPVNATVHDNEGLNLMVYNRCIGTRYCSNNCPYKVRRFNFFNYTNSLPDSIKLQQNPDVTVRSRGVMEKCTFCLQRINLAKQKAKLEGREVRDGEFKTACEQACPPNAITFGNINDPNSEVSKLRRNKRAYGVLSEFNTRPRVQYLAGVLNPNPNLPAPAVEVEVHGGAHRAEHG